MTRSCIRSSCRNCGFLNGTGSCCAGPSGGGPVDSLVLEYMGRGSLSPVLADCRDSPEARALWTTRTMMRVLLDVARGLDFLHHHHIIHRDLKSPNILLDEDFRAKASRRAGGAS
jgi:serine/threonine protein kinase